MTKEQRELYRRKYKISRRLEIRKGDITWGLIVPYSTATILFNALKDCVVSGKIGSVKLQVRRYSPNPNWSTIRDMGTDE